MLDTANEVVFRFNKEGVIPFTAVVDRGGIIRYVHPGYDPGTAASLDLQVQALLAAAERSPSGSPRH
jgi:hypothetical protein